jgi:hypothetical protein
MTQRAPGVTVLTIDAAELAADAVTVDMLARVALTAKRLGAGVRLAHASFELTELIGFMGLASVLGVEPGRHPEQWEQRRRIEEERELGDPPA